jgi:hypothetical protein
MTRVKLCIYNTEWILKDISLIFVIKYYYTFLVLRNFFQGFEERFYICFLCFSVHKLRTLRRARHFY